MELLIKKCVIDLSSRGRSSRAYGVGERDVLSIAMETYTTAVGWGTKWTARGKWCTLIRMNITESGPTEQ